MTVQNNNDDVTGTLSRNDIFDALYSGQLKIFPFDKDKLTGIGYNLSTTNFALSINEQRLLTICTDKNNPQKCYVNIPANDTVLFYSQEYIEVDATLSGTFHAKVARVSQGLGHISTTLDPMWKGQLLFSVNNPTSKELRFALSEKKGNLATMILYRLITPVTGVSHDNSQGRCELLLEHLSSYSGRKRFKEKFSEQKDFIACDFANSLNGEDSFSTVLQDKTNDKYSTTLQSLLVLQKRLFAEQKSFRENTYKVLADGEYQILNEQEQLLVKSCCLYDDIYKSGHYKTSIVYCGKDRSRILDAIANVLFLINYEIESINHIIRIAWQNAKIAKYAAEDSELAKAHKKRHKFKQFLKWIPLTLCTILFATLSIFHFVYSFLSDDNYYKVVIPIFTSLLAFSLGLTVKDFIKIKEREK